MLLHDIADGTLYKTLSTNSNYVIPKLWNMDEIWHMEYDCFVRTVQTLRWEYKRSDGTLNQQENIHFYTEKGMRIMN
jgi:hypothetical protein